VVVSFLAFTEITNPSCDYLDNTLVRMFNPRHSHKRRSQARLVGLLRADERRDQRTSEVGAGAVQWFCHFHPRQRDSESGKST
jgi:hypothetical protein